MKMKNIKFILTAALLGSLLFSCDKDNLDGPNATFAGEIRDKANGDLIAQEVMDGSRVYFIEQGWGDNAPVQNTIIKSDGTFHDGMIFSGNYKIILNKGNYIPMDTIDMKIKPGKNFKVFYVNPYIRVIEPEIFVEGRKVVAKFQLEQVTSASVSKISLFAHSHIDASVRLNLVNKTVELNRLLPNIESFRLEINLDDYSSTLKEGKSYYFRIGALAHGVEAKYNYAPSVKIDL